ncbi:MAG: 4-phosphopantoate--beta-alanine ligase [Nitrosopumilaceae archaeon]
MSLIPKSHPRAKSLFVREKLVEGFDDGLVAKEGLLAHGRGEAFDYLIGEKTANFAKKSIKAAAASMLLADSPIISVNGNIAALCPKEIYQLAKVSKSKIEVNLFYTNEKRRQNIVKTLKKNGVKEVLGADRKSLKKLSGLDSARRFVDKNGIFAADLVLVPLEDGDRTMALSKAGKKVVTFDLNPLSRTAQTADVTIVDNVIRGMKLLIDACKSLSKKNNTSLEKIVKNYDNKKILSESIVQIQKHLKRRAKVA